MGVGCGACFDCAFDRYDEACVEETKGLLGGLFKYCKKKFTADSVRCSRCARQRAPVLTPISRAFTPRKTLPNSSKNHSRTSATSGRSLTKTTVPPLSPQSPRCARLPSRPLPPPLGHVDSGSVCCVAWRNSSNTFADHRPLLGYAKTSHLSLRKPLSFTTLSIVRRP